MRFLRCAPVLALLCASAVSRADSISYTFTYSGVGEVGGASDPGSGSLTYTYTPGSTTGTLSAFTFTDTLQAADGATSTFTYSGLSSVQSSSLLLSANGQLASASIYTNRLSGSDASFGKPFFALYYGGPYPSYTEGDPSSAHYNGGNSDGTVVWTPVPNVATTPEPSSIALLGTGLLGVAGAMRKRFAQVRRRAEPK